MDNAPDNFDETAKKVKMAQTIRLIWIVLTAVFAVTILLRLYEWSIGRDNFRGILSPLGMVFVGLGAIIRPRNKMLSYVFTGIAVILVISGLVMMIVY